MRINFSNVPSDVAQFLTETEASHIEGLADSLAATLGLDSDHRQLLEANLLGTVARFVDSYLHPPEG